MCAIISSPPSNVKIQIKFVKVLILIYNQVKRHNAFECITDDAVRPSDLSPNHRPPKPNSASHSYYEIFSASAWTDSNCLLFE